MAIQPEDFPYLIFHFSFLVARAIGSLALVA